MLCMKHDFESLRPLGRCERANDHEWTNAKAEGRDMKAGSGHQTLLHQQHQPAALQAKEESTGRSRASAFTSRHGSRNLQRQRSYGRANVGELLDTVPVRVSELLQAPIPKGGLNNLSKPLVLLPRANVVGKFFVLSLMHHFRNDADGLFDESLAGAFRSLDPASRKTQGKSGLNLLFSRTPHRMRASRHPDLWDF